MALHWQTLALEYKSKSNLITPQWHWHLKVMLTIFEVARDTLNCTH